MASNLRPHSCTTCQRLILDERPRSGPRTQQGEEHNFIHFDFTFSDIIAAPNECQFCVWLLGEEWIHRSTIVDKVLLGREISENDPESAVKCAVAEAFIRHDSLLPPPDPTKTLRNWADLQGHNVLDNLKLACFYHELRMKFFVLWNPEERRVEYRSRGGFGVFARTGQSLPSHDTGHAGDVALYVLLLLTIAAGNPASRIVSTRPVEQQPLTSVTLERVSTWIAECLEGRARGRRIHTRCPRPVDDFLPKRLIEISHDANQEYLLKLIETDSLHAKGYIALSYCWGGDQLIKTTRALLPSWMEDIPWEKLPATLKDAIVVCAKLGIPYIWIDAFCIVQDDPEEKAVEIAQMPKIYENSTLTVAIARAASVNDGFLQPRNYEDDLASAFELPFQCHRPVSVGSVTLLKVPNKPEPLDIRGWTLQERLLAPRTLEFGSLQTRFFCQHNPRGFTDGWSLAPANHASRQDSVQDVQILHTRFDSIRDHNVQGYNIGFEEAMNNWYHLVETYTHRQLTVPTDRILAISGIADRYGQAFGDQYCAGLWRSGFPRALFWRHSGKIQRRPRDWQGPSWSWTSISGPIKFPSPSPMDDDDSSILHVDIELANRQSSFGALLEGSGRLTIRARLNAAVLIFKESQGLVDDLDVYAGFLILGRGNEGDDAATRMIRISYDSLDESEEEMRENNAVLMELQTKCTTHRWMTRGLVCRSLSEDTFTRVGIFEYETVQDSRREGESLDDWYKRVDRSLNWFKLLPFSEYSII
ncbi:hypothetical protein CEP54_010094 [Fusarium duplospermum]|uniref:Heterokaryon incompatibility domain-containing protein n=1 Tax=Fusarium duplospermum TaxID=1325734 RepID=A0A428PM43_9HYPO|nr:hypothetical protein CEP54_010094 [Fusarium duplospermum]